MLLWKNLLNFELEPLKHTAISLMYFFATSNMYTKRDNTQKPPETDKKTRNNKENILFSSNDSKICDSYGPKNK